MNRGRLIDQTHEIGKGFLNISLLGAFRPDLSEELWPAFRGKPGFRRLSRDSRVKLDVPVKFDLTWT